MNIYVFQRGKRVGPFSQEDIRLQLLGGQLKPTHLAWHSRLAEWVPLGELTKASLIDVELAAPPDPEHSSHYKPREEKSRERSNERSSRSSERSGERSERSRNGRRSRERAGDSSSSSEEKSERSEKSTKRIRRTRSIDTSEVVTSRQQKKKGPVEINLWKVVKDFFRN